jgi:hypothetical protein
MKNTHNSSIEWREISKDELKNKYNFFNASIITSFKIQRNIVKIKFKHLIGSGGDIKKFPDAKIMVTDFDTFNEFEIDLEAEPEFIVGAYTEDILELRIKHYGQLNDEETDALQKIVFEGRGTRIFFKEEK